jgi:hypothetical protein
VPRISTRLLEHAMRRIGRNSLAPQVSTSERTMTRDSICHNLNLPERRRLTLEERLLGVYLCQR